jgi:hypothetical protein
MPIQNVNQALRLGKSLKENEERKVHTSDCFGALVFFHCSFYVGACLLIFAYRLGKRLNILGGSDFSNVIGKSKSETRNCKIYLK